MREHFVYFSHQPMVTWRRYVGKDSNDIFDWIPPLTVVESFLDFPSIKDGCFGGWHMVILVAFDYCSSITPRPAQGKRSYPLHKKRGAKVSRVRDLRSLYCIQRCWACRD